MTWAPAEHLFGFGPLHFDDLAIALLAAVVLITGLEAIKRFWHSRLIA